MPRPRRRRRGRCSRSQPRPASRRRRSYTCPQWWRERLDRRNKSGMNERNRQSTFADWKLMSLFNPYLNCPSFFWDICDLFFNPNDHSSRAGLSRSESFCSWEEFLPSWWFLIPIPRGRRLGPRGRGPKRTTGWSRIEWRRSSRCNPGNRRSGGQTGRK